MKRELGRFVSVLIILAVVMTAFLQNRSVVSARESEAFFGTASGTVAVLDVNGKSGKITVQITVESSLPVKEVSVPVWCAEDKSDLYCYTAEQDSENTYLAEIRVSKHKYHMGQYRIDAYASLEGGQRRYLGEARQYFSPVNFMTVRKTDNPYERKITLRNVNAWADSVSFAVWSEAGEQDDLIWNEAERNEDGSWSAVIPLNQYLHEGRFLAHAYVDGKYAAAKSFEVDITEMGKYGWYYENGLKLFYIRDQVQTDVRDKVEGPYRIHVNRTCNTITIYSAQDEDDYIIPVVSFACSVGLPETPTPTGTFYTGAKYRWKTLMGPSYGQYVTHVVYSVYFHSVAGYNMTPYNLNAGDFNALGGPASHGCIRLCVRDAKWMYENIPSGSPVYIYDSEDPGPFGKPELPKIPPEQNWDPTDPNA